MFTVAISYLTTSNLPWFMDLTFQVPVQYCSLQLQTLLPSPVTSTPRWCFCFGSVSSFFFELFLQWSLVAYWGPTDLGSSSFCDEHKINTRKCFGGSQGKYTEVVCHSLLQWTTFCSELSTMTHLFWVALQGMARSFIELDKAVVYVISFLWLWFSFCLPSDGEG